MFVVDTNILVYAANQNAELQAASSDLLARWRGRASAWYLTWGIAYEFLRVATHRGIFPQPLSMAQALDFLTALFESPGLSILVPTRRHPDVLREVASEVHDLRGSIVHDLTTAVLMREHGIRTIYTRDTHFRRFPFLEVVDPLSA